MESRKRKATRSAAADEEEKHLEGETKKKKTTKSKKDTNSKKNTNGSSSSLSNDDPMIECEASSDEFIQFMVETIKKLKDEESLRRLFSDQKDGDAGFKQKELSIHIVKHLKVVADEFLVSVSQAEMFMKHNDIQSINQDNYCLYRIDIPDIWAIIFSYLPISDFIHMNRVCKLWHQASELPQALVHYDYPSNSKGIFNFGHKQFFDKYISFRSNSIKSYSGNKRGIEMMIQKHDIKAIRKHDERTALNKDATNAHCFSIETTDVIFEKLEKLSCFSSAILLNILAKPQNALELFPSLKHLHLSAATKKTKEIIISHPTLTSLDISSFANVSVKCPMLEKCKASMIQDLTVESKHIISLDLQKIGQLSIIEPSMAWNLQSLEEVKYIVKLDCPFVKSAYIGHESMIKYLPNLVRLTLNGDSLGYDCLKKLTSTKLLKEIGFKNFKNEELPDKKTLKQALQSIEYISFDECTSEFIATILESLSSCLRGVKFSKIGLTKTVLDAFDSSSLPNLHIFRLDCLTRTLFVKGKTHFQKCLKRMKSINKLSLQFSKSASIEIDIPEHIEQLEIDCELEGSVDSKLVYSYKLPSSGEFNNVEYFCFRSQWDEVDLKAIETKYPTLRYLEGVGVGKAVGHANRIEYY